ncbi:hypothetical protein BAE44_0011800 [Dichanthelium oligosanthes]|uniref:Uncharacterized protein n=1 Tax=Dichanthelium oligosanthes TaxID=888268 RepID=A0A1E5VQ49_9POAL|nr:hypothetical protein BAE44_0011800 [Dichanthelium oligosanthes]
MDGAMDEFQEADILWPDTEDELVPFAFVTTDMVMEEPYEVATSSASSVAPLFGRRRFEGLFLPSAAATSSSAGVSPDADDDEEEWQEADVLWPDTVDIVPCGAGGGRGSLWPFPGGSGRAGRHVSHPAAARRDWWSPAASSPIDIPANAADRVREKSCEEMLWQSRIT